MDDKTQFAIDSGNPIWPFILGGTIFGIFYIRRDTHGTDKGYCYSTFY